MGCSDQLERNLHFCGPSQSELHPHFVSYKELFWWCRDIIVLTLLFPAEESVHESNEELEKEVEEQKRRRRRKRKPAPARHSGKHGVALSESSTGQSRVPVDEEWERLSKNKRRKLKKKRHKEKMMSLGLLPRAAALEFTYHKDGEEEEEEDNKRRVAELSDFLRTTTEIYMSDSKY